jgi:transposase InsO family protein
MDKGRFLIETHLRTPRPIGELAEVHGVSRSWLYKLLARYRLEGELGLEPRSRRPHLSPNRISDQFEDEIVLIRKRLSDVGLDAGAETIRYHLEQIHRTEAPSASTIYRVLKQRGFVNPEPKKRPHCSYTRFTAELPNECWQADFTHWDLTNGLKFEILNVIDDHSRLLVASRAFVRIKSPDVVRTLHYAAESLGFPETFLTDNGLVFTTRRLKQSGMGAFETELYSLGIKTKHSKPNHPQTCGKVERFHQTMKKHLVTQDEVSTKKQLQGVLDRFRHYYNEVRPHRSIGRRPPIEAYNALVKAHPQGPFIDTRGYRVRRDKVDTTGKVTLRYNGRLHHIGIGRPYAGWKVIMLIDGLNIQVIGVDGSPLRRLVLDPTRGFQAQS